MAGKGLQSRAERGARELQPICGASLREQKSRTGAARGMRAPTPCLCGLPVRGMAVPVRQAGRRFRPAFRFCIADPSRKQSRLETTRRASESARSEYIALSRAAAEARQRSDALQLQYTVVVVDASAPWMLRTGDHAARRSMTARNALRARPVTHAFDNSVVRPARQLKQA